MADLGALVALGDKDLIKAVVEDESLALARDAKTSWTGLHHAAKTGRAAAAATLLAARADPCARTHHDSTALHVAACQGHLDVAVILVRGECPLEARDNKGNTALLRACQHGHAPIVQHLLGVGADATARNDAGQSAEDRAREGNHEDVLEALGVTRDTRQRVGHPAPARFAAYLRCGAGTGAGPGAGPGLAPESDAAVGLLRALGVATLVCDLQGDPALPGARVSASRPAWSPAQRRLYALACQMARARRSPPE